MSNHEEFGVVRDRLNFIFDIVTRNTSVRPMIQKELNDGYVQS